MPRIITTELFKNKASNLHKNKYDYSLVDFVNSLNKIKIICPIHGLFEQTPNKHLSKKGCSKCGFISRCNKAKSNTSEFISKAIEKHGDKYDYSKVEYLGKENKIFIICKKHGEFIQTPHNHLAGNGCPICRNSNGENEIRVWLVKNKINFITQKRFDDCRHILPLPFDLYLPNINVCIEFQGIQHFKPRTKFGGIKEFEKTILRDKIKVDYCNKNNISLIIIDYKENINDILFNNLSYILKTTT